MDVPVAERQSPMRGAAVPGLGVKIGLIVVLVVTMGLVSPGTGRAAPTLPAGFVVQALPSGQSELLTDFAFAPDGSYFTTGKNGRVAWVSADGQARTLATLPVVTVQDLGLSGIAVASDYDTSRVVYLARTLMVNGQWTARLSAVPIEGSPPTSLGAERVIWDLPVQADVHTITGIVAAQDGTLWVTMGDAADFRFVDPLALRALDVDTGYGKLLHLTTDGQGVPSNPYFDPADPGSWRSRVYASGFRSPFRLSLDPTTGAPILGDVGWGTWEEVDVIRPGASYGWPCWEGDTRTPGYGDMAACQGVGNAGPLWTYAHGPLGTSVTGGTVYTGSSYPAEYRGAYFYGDYASQRVYSLRHDGQGNLVRQPEAAGFGTGNGAPVAFARAPGNGDIVYADILGAQLKRLVYVAGNRPPTADAVISSDPASTRTFTFDGGGSSDLDATPLTYAWDFGDGTGGTGATVVHAYGGTATAPLTARLTVTDPQGATGTTTLTVVPGNRVPVLSMVLPPAAQQYAVGERVSLSATATDPEDGALPVTWSVVLVHCGGGYCHDHPGQTFAGGTYDLPFEDHGDETRLEITAAATDTAGVRTDQTFVAQPRVRTLTLQGDVPAAMTVNGVARATATVTAGARVSVSAPTVAADGVATFERWADVAGRERLLVMPDADTTLTATYLTPIDRRYAAEPGLRTVLGTPTGVEAGDGSLRFRTYTAGRMYWTPAAGTHEVHGEILQTYLLQGGHVALGEPLTDETTTADGRGRYNGFAFNGASIHWLPGIGARAVYGDIAGLWNRMGAERGIHGYPTSDEHPTPDRRGRYNDFQNGGIYWMPAIGAHSVYGAIYQKWAALRWEAGFLRFPLTDESGTPDGVGRYNHFEGGSVYWTPRTGAHEVHGAIRGRWEGLGWERSFLGYPTTDESVTPDGVGRYNHFEGGSVYWTPRTGAFEVHGAIRDRWRSLGWEGSYLGYPTSDEFSVPGGRRSNFERGYIVWDASTGGVIDSRS